MCEDKALDVKGAKTERKGSKNHLKVLYLNARSIRNKINELTVQLSIYSYDIVAITETWLQGDQDWELNIEGYSTIRKDRQERKGGGVALLIREGITAIERKDIALKDQDSETAWVQIENNKGKKTLVGVIYRPPNSCDAVSQNINLQIVDACKKGTAVIMGDFNFHINWANQTGQGRLEEEFIESIRDGFLEQYVTEPTRGEAILDLVLCNEAGLIKNVIVRDSLGTSDHNMVEFHIQIEGEQVETQARVLSLNKGDYEGMRTELIKVDWDSRLKNKTVHEQWCTFKGILYNLQEKFIPMKKKRGKGKNSQPWLSKTIKDSIRLKARAYKVARDSGRVEDWEAFKGQQKITKRLIKTGKIDYERNLANNIKTNSKSFYSYIKRKRVAKVNVGPLEGETGELLVGNMEMAKALNEYFVSVFTIEDTKNIPTLDKQGAVGMEELNTIKITKEVVLGKLMRLKEDKSPGPDGLHPRVLREIAVGIVDALVIIFQNSLEAGTVPVDWKMANVTPIFKKGSKQKAGNYRPVSLTSVVGKMLETIIKETLTGHLDKHDFIGQNQHGFVKGKSCLTNLLEFFEEVTTRVDKGEPVDVVYLDFQKAFDKVPHKRLLLKIKNYGIGGNILAWVEDWLTNRKQRVGINGSYSGWQPVTSGVPQGSVLGPQLFTIYINDLEEGTKCNISKFADDTKMGGKVGDEEDRKSLQKDIDKLGEWATTWQMKFNTNKCEVIHFGKKNDRASYFLNEEELRCNATQRDLGVLVHESLKVSMQVQQAIRKANGVLAFIARGIEYKNTEVLLQLYTVLVRPHLEYCVQFWGPYLRKDVLALEAVQRRFTRLIPAMRGLTYEERLSRLELYSLEFRRMRGDLIETYKIVRGLDRVDAPRMFPMIGETRTRGHSCRIRGGSFKTEMRKNFFTQRVVNLWNSLPQGAVEAETLNIFKTKIDGFLAAKGIRGYGERAGIWT